jgi:hypothetical protein
MAVRHRHRLLGLIAHAPERAGRGAGVCRMPLGLPCDARRVRALPPSVARHVSWSKATCCVRLHETARPR